MIFLRPARESDADTVFEWRNDPWIVALSAGRSTVARAEHEAWFSATLASDKRRLYIIEDSEGWPMGTLRLDRSGTDKAFITVYLMRPFVGEGRGSRAIREGTRKALDEWPQVEQVEARIRPDNQRSLRAFAKCGYTRRDTRPDREEDMVSMICERTQTGGDYRDRLERFYGPLLKNGSEGHVCVGWGSGESQRLRFRVLTDVADARSASVLDVGCGLGHFTRHLNELRFDGIYRGIDPLPEMVRRAKEAHPGWQFEVGDIDAESPGSTDYAFASGIFTIADMDLLERTVSRMYRCCRRAAAFNSLSSWAPEKEAGEFHADPLQVLDYCRRLSPYVTLRHDYLPHDFTVYLYKRGSHS